MLKISTELVRRFLPPAVNPSEPVRRDSRSNPPSTLHVLGLRLPNPSPTGWAIIVAGATAALVLGSVAYASSGPSKPVTLPDIEPDLECDPDPYDVDMADIVAAISATIANGELDKAIVATNVATMLFGSHPGGGIASFPPGASPLPGVMCVWSVVVFVVEDEFDKRGLGDKPVPEVDKPTGSLKWVTRKSSDPGYPWEEPVLQVDNWPSPGMFVNVGVQGDWNPSQGYDSMIKAYLGTALAMAGMDVGIAEQQGGLGQSLRKQLREAVTAVGGFNDLLYGQTNENYAGGNNPNKPGANNPNGGVVNYMMNDEGRGLNWLPRHKDVIPAVASGQKLDRGTRLDGAKLGGSNGGSQHMVVWLAALDLAQLQNGVVAFLTWSDGSSTLDPPPQIRDLGVDMHGVMLPGI